MKLYLLSMVALMFFSGCSVKIYHAPSIDLTIKDPVTKQPVKGVKLSPLDGTNGELSDSDGKIKFDGRYERRWHTYPFPIISGGSYEYYFFKLSHPGYSEYELNCNFTSLGGFCGPAITKIDKNKRELLIECDGCHKAKKVVPCETLKTTGVITIIVDDNGYYLSSYQPDKEFQDKASKMTLMLPPELKGKIIGSKYPAEVDISVSGECDSPWSYKSIGNLQ